MADLLTGIYEEMVSTPSPMPTQLAALQAALASPASAAIFMSLAVKGAPRPFLVLNLVAGPPAEASLDGISALREGEVQFDAYADSQQAARGLLDAVRDFWMLGFVTGTLPDGTAADFVDVTVDQDEPYELGGEGYIHRALLRLKALWTFSPTPAERGENNTDMADLLTGIYEEPS